MLGARSSGSLSAKDAIIHPESSNISSFKEDVCHTLRSSIMAPSMV